MINPVKNNSYINKDFNTIYTELLDIVKSLSPRWDPTVSNESDPGVLLLKTQALIGDKSNYNIDKNILEVFPETVTQEVNARSMYKQLGYTIPWYISATGNISMKWLADKFPDAGQEIPRYTMVTDAENKCVYTILEPIMFTENEPLLSVPVIEGTIVDHKVNNSTTITLEALDSNNRLYLNDYTVAENGVFITNVGNDETLWKRVENIQTVEGSSLCYEFGVDPRNQLCYIEFPVDISVLIGGGLRIRYVVSQGEKGNITANFIDRFYSSVTLSVDSNSQQLNEDILRITNLTPIDNGFDPMPISDAYRNYMKVASTFDTYVTLRDYTNALYNSGLVSNGVVSDRTNDLQSSYYVMTEDEVNPLQRYTTCTATEGYGFTRLNNINELPSEGLYIYDTDTGVFSPVEKDKIKDEDLPVYYKHECVDVVPDMSAFDLRLYMLKTSSNINNVESYNNSFNIVEPDNKVNKEAELFFESSKCIQHDFKTIKPEVPCMFKNCFPLNIRIIPQFFLTDEQINDVKINILKSLWKVCNSRNIDFGEEPNYDLIYSTIESADSRIKVVVLDDFTYTTYACYWDVNDKTFKEIPLNMSDDNPLLHIDNPKDATYSTWQESTNWAKGILSETLLESMYFLSKDRKTFGKYNKKTKSVETYSNKLSDFRKEIIAKSVLAGTTPLFYLEDTYNTRADQKAIGTESVSNLTTTLQIAINAVPHDSDTQDVIFPVVVEDVKDDGSTFVSEVSEQVVSTDIPQFNSQSLVANEIHEYPLQPNESLRVFTPSFKDEVSYGNYVKFELVLNNRNGGSKFNFINSELIPEETYAIEMNSLFQTLTFLYEKKENENGEGETLKEYSQPSNLLQDVYNEVTELKVTGGTNSIYYNFVYNGTNGPSEYKAIDSYLSALSSNNQTILDEYYYGDNNTPITFDTNNLANIYVYLKKIMYTVPAETDYQLKDGDSIAFFWRDSEDEDAPYQFKRYEGDNTIESPIIRPTFDVQGVGKWDQKVSDDTYKNKTSGYISYQQYNAYQTISGFYGTNDLSGSRSVVIRKLRSGKFNPTDRYYFISNLYSDNYYVLKFQNEAPEGKDAKWTYILQNDEYFFRVSRTHDEIEMLGAGTLIQITGDSNFEGFLDVKKLTLDEIQENASEVLKDVTKPLNSSITLKYTEQNVYNIVNGSTLVFEATVTDTNEEAPIFSSWENTVVKSDKYKLSYYSEGQNANSAQLVSTSMLNEPSVRARAYLNIDASKESPQTITYINSDKMFKHSTNFNTTGLEANSNGETSKIHGFKLIDNLENLSNIGKDLLKGTPANKVYRNVNGDTSSTDTWEDVSPVYSDYKFSNCVDENLDTQFIYHSDTTCYFTFDLTKSLPITDFVVAFGDKSLVQSEQYIVSIYLSPTKEGCISEEYKVCNFTAEITDTNGKSFRIFPQKKLSSGKYVDTYTSGRYITFQIENKDKSDTLYCISELGAYTEAGGYSTQGIYTQKTSEGETSWEMINPYTEQNTEYTFQTSYPLLKVGGYNLDTTFKNILGNTKATGLYYYTEEKSTESNDWIINTSGDIECTAENDNEEFVFNLGKIVKPYILTVSGDRNSYQISFNNILFNNNASNKIITLLNTNSSQNKTYYKINVNTDDENNTLTIKVLESNKSVIINSLKWITDDVVGFDLYKKYEDTGIDVTTIQSKVQELDLEGKFKYDYSIPEDKLIKDPLDGKSFFLENHICNSYTIAKAECELASNDVNSSILIIGNR